VRLKSAIVPLALAAAGFVIVLEGGEFANLQVKQPFDAMPHGQASKTSGRQILYHGGPVMNVSNTVYAIYYGTQFAATTQPIINDFLYGLNNSAQYGINTTYNAGGTTPYIPPSYSFTAPSSSSANPNGSVYWDNYSQGAQIGNNSVPKIVANAINNGLPYDANGVYLVITSPDVKIAGFCNSFCAYHTSSNITVSTLSGERGHVRYALIPDPTQRCGGCNGSIAVYGDSITPNGDMGADTMTDDIMHELSETVTDPDISAWYAQNGAEVADLCNYVYGTVSTGVSGGQTYHYNAYLPRIGSGYRPYLIQQIWKNSGSGFCASN
jgi:hypothetical protein